MFAEDHNNLGNAYFQRHEFDEAVAQFRLALRLRPDFVEAHNNLGLALATKGELDAALEHYHQALRLKPDSAETHCNVACIYFNQGKLDEAAATFRNALRLKPDLAQAHYNLALTLTRQEKLDEAIRCYQNFLRLQPNAQACCNLGMLFERQSNVDLAFRCYRQALQFEPGHAEAGVNLGSIHLEQGRVNEAIVCFRQVLNHHPDCSQAHYNLGLALERQKQDDDAAESYLRVLWHDPNNAEAQFNLGNIFARQGKPVDAIQAFEATLRLKPTDKPLGRVFALAHSNLGEALLMQGELDRALTNLEQALLLDPQLAGAHWNRAFLWLLRGDFDRGWPESEWRWSLEGANKPRFVEPLWDGSPLKGRTILLHAEQGLGDTFQFIRFAPLVKQLGGKVIFECQPPLMAILRSAPGIDHLLAQGSARPRFEVQAPLLSLPGILRTSLANVPSRIPYLFADEQLVDEWRMLRGQEMASRERKRPEEDSFLVGIAWQGNPKYRSDRQRSIPLEHFAALARVPGVKLVSLQKRRAGTVSDRSDFDLLEFGEEFDSTAGAFMDTAAIMKNLDLVITSDTAVAHLAGALGVPVWVALSFVPDWRWLMEREDTPWYPTMRVFRQTSYGDWKPVFASMADELHRISLLTPDS